MMVWLDMRRLSPCGLVALVNSFCKTESIYINPWPTVSQRNQGESQFPTDGLPHALAQASAAEPDKVYPQWPVSFLAAYGTTLKMIVFCFSSPTWGHSRPDFRRPAC